MEVYLQATALVMVAVLLLPVLRQNREMGMLLSLAVCCGVSLAAVALFRPAAELLEELRRIGGLDGEILPILLKCTGIGVLSELAGMICTDAGEQAMAKAVKLLANAAVLLLSLPMVRQLTELLEEVLGRV